MRHYMTVRVLASGLAALFLMTFSTSMALAQATHTTRSTHSTAEKKEDKKEDDKKDDEKNKSEATHHTTHSSRSHSTTEKKEESAPQTTHSPRTHSATEKNEEPAHHTTRSTRSHAATEKKDETLAETAEKESGPAQTTAHRATRTAHKEEEPIRASRNATSKAPAKIHRAPRPTMAGNRLRAEHAELNSPVMQGLQIDKEFSGRLPNGYGKVVTDDQRQEIYEVQKDYADVIELLKLRLLLLEQERDEKIDGMLNADQVREIKSENGQLESDRHRAKLDEAKN